jgi:hypothetical protein
MADELESLLADLEGGVSAPSSGSSGSYGRAAPTSRAPAPASSRHVDDSTVNDELDSLMATLGAGPSPPTATATAAATPITTTTPTSAAATERPAVGRGSSALRRALPASSAASASTSSSSSALDEEDALLDALISDLQSGETKPTRSAQSGVSGLRRMDSLDMVAAQRRDETVGVRTGHSELDSLLDDMQSAFTRHDQCAVGQAKVVQASKGEQEQLQEVLLVLQSTRSRPQDIDVALRKVVGLAADDAKQSLFTNANCVQPVLATLRSSNTQHQLLAAVALLNMAVNMACRETIGRLADASLLVDLIHPSSPVVLQEKCVGCLLNLCAENGRILCVRECVCTLERERECVCVCMRERVCVCAHVYMRENVYVCVCT